MIDKKDLGIYNESENQNQLFRVKVAKEWKLKSLGKII